MNAQPEPADDFRDDQIPPSLITSVPQSTPTVLFDPAPIAPTVSTQGVSKANWLKLSLVILLVLMIISGVTFGTIKFLSKEKNAPQEQVAATSVTDDTGKDLKPSTEAMGFSEISDGHLDASQSVSVPIAIDSVGSNIFYLSWIGEKPTLTLTSPDGQMINEAYAKAYPDQVQYEYSKGSPETPPMMGYTVTTTTIGNWKMNITSSKSIDYRVFAILSSGPTLKVDFSSPLYKVGESAHINAVLKSTSQLDQVTIVAKITRPDSKTEVIPLIDQGDGVYTAMYVIPEVAGYLSGSVVVKGLSNNTPFTRESMILTSVNAQQARFTGVYSEKPVDKDGDGLYDYLDFKFEVESQTKGSFAISAELESGTRSVAHRGDFFDLVPGKQTLTFSFYGNDILESKADGPYTITKLFLTPIEVGITADEANDVLQTRNYRYSQFKTAK